MRRRFRNSIRWCKTYPGADVGSDHNPLIAKVCIKLKRAAPRNQRKKEFIDWGKLEVPEVREKYFVEVKNRFEVLAIESDLQ